MPTKSTAKRAPAKPRAAASPRVRNAEVRSCPSCKRVHGHSFVSETELPMLGDVRGRTEDGSPTGRYRVWVHDGVFYIRAVLPDDETEVQP